IEPQALVDEVFLELSSNAAARPTNLSLEQWMIQVTRQKLRSRLRELRQLGEEPRVEESVDAELQWEDEALNFYQPDESLHLADLIEDQRIETPEEALQREEAEQQLRAAIARLPEDVRESFVLFALEGFTSDEVAMITGREPQLVLQEVEKARHALRQEMQS
ncbi:MAG TPA: sigma-70 family RNA polymerase sigma factor, partial [Acidobacteriota bacterium]|nr:sigma-70 family RNA polymerase sigma factor [Acidobacteriota bacterium]